MKITLSWLKEHLKTEASPEEIADRLSAHGLVVDGIENPGEALKGFTIAQITKTAPHPNADRLKLCQVNTGKETLQVVCGDPKVSEGMKVVLAVPGVVIPSTGEKLRPGIIREVESQGMMCSASELGLEEDSAGIIELEANAPIGARYADIIGLNDPVLDIEITPNRGDCLGASGLARDLSASEIGTLVPLKVPEISGSFPCPTPIVIEKKSQGMCPMFAGRVIRNVKNGPSPEWMQARIRAIGLRPISALVDITNYLAYDLGRPMHVFDADKVAGTITIRQARGDEKIRALDGKDYSLNAEMLVVADDKAPLSIAGIIGGEASGCTDTTTNVFVESAIFDPICVAQTGRTLNVLSDSRYRFERGVDPTLVVPAIEFATRFIIENCGGEVSEISVAGAEPTPDLQIDFHPSQVKRLGGIEISQETAISILEKLGLKTTKAGADHVTVSVPSWRHDITMGADLVEEVLRVYGYDKIKPTPLPKLARTDRGEIPGSAKNHLGWVARKALAMRGLTEAVTWSFVREDRAKLFGGGDPTLKIVNPISVDLSDMRPCILPNLITACGRNRDRGLANGALFEVGAQFSNATPGGEATVAAGVRFNMTSERHWAISPRAVDTFDVKADVMAVLKGCGLDVSSVQINREAPSWYHPGRSGVVSLGPKRILATFGELHPRILSAMDVKGPIVGFEVFLENIPIPRRRRRPSPLEVSTLQSVERDFAFEAEATITAEQILRAIRKADKDHITDAYVFDVYAGAGIQAGHKSIAIAVTLRPKTVTFTEAEISQISGKIVHEVQTQTGATLRS